MSEIIYILSNPTMPGIIKIGHTSNLKKRVKRLSSHSGVPVPFEVYYACTITDSRKVEKGIHDGFGDHRINPKREFFKVNPERVLAILKLVEIDDKTPREDIVEGQEDRQALTKERSRKSNFKFSTVDIRPGVTLSFVRDEEIQVKVIDDKNVSFGNDRLMIGDDYLKIGGAHLTIERSPVSLSQSALTLLNQKFGKKLTSARGPDFWVFENETLSERRERMEAED